MTRLFRTPLLALTLAAVGATAFAENPKAGQWSQQGAISADGQNWKPFPPRQECMTAAQAAQSIEQRLQTMVSQAVQSGCKPIEVKAGAGQAHGRFECAQPGKPATIEVDGSYAGDRYNMTLVGTNLMDRNGSGTVIPKMHMKYEGKHVGACAG
ncbi:MAG TPA: DUF3617 family protein [Ideonella sp.]|uniref:DUF3617 domain-containing protein n=1 Tax=Ideonella sp. TaxID=1929293 RepID=UPI002E348FA8|nr:DUF3617 family protein [Ideonella sp.]HEX5684682.1 DUF3617 family protein [Ideonella sp.]